VILCGIEAHVCIYQTVLELLANNYEVYLLCDAISNQRGYEREIALQTLQKKGAILTSTESMIFQVMQTAEHPKFRDVSKTVINYNKMNPEWFQPSN
jgi:isochorismate hydrolase